MLWFRCKAAADAVAVLDGERNFAKQRRGAELPGYGLRVENRRHLLPEYRAGKLAIADVRARLAAKCVSNLKEAIVDAWILSCGAVVRDVVNTVFGANGSCFGAVQFESGPKVKGEVKGTSL